MKTTTPNKVAIKCRIRKAVKTYSEAPVNVKPYKHRIKKKLNIWKRAIKKFSRNYWKLIGFIFFVLLIIYTIKEYLKWK